MQCLHRVLGLASGGSSSGRQHEDLFRTAKRVKSQSLRQPEPLGETICKYNSPIRAPAYSSSALENHRLEKWTWIPLYP
jgi:hypothetical protein